jgi:hypothetical protein
VATWTDDAGVADPPNIDTTAALGWSLCVTRSPPFRKRFRNHVIAGAPELWCARWSRNMVTVEVAYMPLDTLKEPLIIPGA